MHSKVPPVQPHDPGLVHMFHSQHQPRHNARNLRFSYSGRRLQIHHIVRGCRCRESWKAKSWRIIEHWTRLIWTSLINSHGKLTVWWETSNVALGRVCVRTVCVPQTHRPHSLLLAGVGHRPLHQLYPLPHWHLVVLYPVNGIKVEQN